MDPGVTQSNASAALRSRVFSGKNYSARPLYDDIVTVKTFKSPLFGDNWHPNFRRDIQLVDC